MLLLAGAGDGSKALEVMALLLAVMVVGFWGAEARRDGLLGRERGQDWEPETLTVAAEAVKSSVGLCHQVVVTPPLHSPRLRQVFKWVTSPLSVSP